MSKNIKNLLSLFDIEFVNSAYHTVLGRAPDVEGAAYYLARLREGAPKLEILKQLRRSSEGRMAPPVPGLDSEITRHRLANLPLVGALFRLLMPSYETGGRGRQLRIITNEVARMRAEQGALTSILLRIGDPALASIAAVETSPSNAPAPAQANAEPDLSPYAMQMHRRLARAFARS